MAYLATVTGRPLRTLVSPSRLVTGGVIAMSGLMMGIGHLAALL